MREILFTIRYHISKFEIIAPVAQLDRVPDYESGGRGFESSPVRHFPNFFWIYSMIWVGLTIFWNRFWYHLFSFWGKALARMEPFIMS